MNGFKLLAIRPLKGCDKELLKVLQEDRLYPFHQDFKVKYSDDDKKPLTYKYKTNPFKEIFSIENTNISINAIVGKNGTGKSTLMELLFAMIYNLSVASEILKYNSVIQPKKEIPGSDKNENDKIELIPNLKVELYYEVNEKVKCIKIDTGQNRILNDINYIITFHDSVENYSFKEKTITAEEIIKENLFYNICINYSLYSLNSNDFGTWLKYLFHKNDAYRTPIVINPMRKEGKIDVNREKDLLQQRLLSNILTTIEPERELKDSIRCLAPDKIVSSLNIVLNNKYSNKKAKSSYSYKIFIHLFKSYTKSTIDNYLIYINDPFELKKKLVDYIQYKIERILDKYVYYEEFKNIIDQSEEYNEELVKIFCNKIIKDQSHITNKIKQALNFLNKPNIQIIYSEKYNLNKLMENINKEIQIQKNENNRTLRIIEFLPPPIYTTEIVLNDNFKFDKMSSGEKQKIYSSHSILYHLLNLNSVHDNGSQNNIKYKNINIIFDEIELYYHPELQRTFIKDLIDNFKKIKLDKINSINICLITHSPFILSDIPRNNILQLKLDKNKKSKKVKRKKKKETFGANIHKLLIESFFNNKRLMGEFAHQTIVDLIQNIEQINPKDFSDNKIEELKQHLSLIGEPFFRIKLTEKLNSKVEKRNSNDKDI